MLTSLPNLLTLSRIGAIPVMVGLFFVNAPWAVWVILALYCAAAVTDYLDGVLARRLAQTSAFGRFLDPIADKLLVAAILFMLVATSRIAGLAVVPAVVILMREVLISGLREFMAGVGAELPVSQLAKWKTAIQMIAIGVLILGDQGPGEIPVASIGTAALWGAAVLTVASAWAYFRIGFTYLNGAAGPEPAPAGGDPPVRVRQ